MRPTDQQLEAETEPLRTYRKSLEARVQKLEGILGNLLDEVQNERAHIGKNPTKAEDAARAALKEGKS